MSVEVGKVSLGVELAGQKLQSQMQTLVGGIAKKAGAVLGAALSVKALAGFSKKCIELGSDLAEVQNVVDVTFPAMSAKVDAFARSAASSFGLSETMAKKFTGTFGSMAEAFGFSEQAAYEMSTTLTGLAGDVASFYNISQDEAYTKLKSVFSGETETLKDLGIVMTQASLDAYAMANGFGRTTAQMTEAEKVSLRYAFVQDQLKNAAGDFWRTQDSWANQSRLLALQARSAMAAVGQGLINILSPVLSWLNAVMAKLVQAAKLFPSFTERIFGKKGAGAASATADSMTSAAGAISSASDNAGGLVDHLGGAAKSAKALQRQLMSFDQITKLSDDSDSGSGSGSSGGGGAGTGDLGGATDALNSALDDTQQQAGKLEQVFNGLFDRFRAGFAAASGDVERNLEVIRTKAESVGSSLAEIFTAKKVVDAAQTLADNTAYALGRITGAAANTATAAAATLVSGFAAFLDRQKGFLQDKLSSILTIRAERIQLAGDLAETLGNIVSNALSSDAAVSITESIFTILSAALLTAWEQLEKVGLDVFHLLADPFIENAAAIQTAIDNVLKPVATVLEGFSTAVQRAGDSVSKVYDDHIGPLFDTLRTGASDSFGKWLEVYNSRIAPMLQLLGDKVSDLWTEHFSPAFDKISGLVGSAADALSEFYTSTVKPIVDWCAQNIVPVFAGAFTLFGLLVIDAVDTVIDVIGDLADILHGIIDFWTGVVSGDWSKTWDGFQTMVQGAVDNVLSVLNLLCGTDFKVNIKAVFKDTAAKIKKSWDKLTSGVKDVTRDMKAQVVTRWQDLKAAWSSIVDNIRDKTASLKAKIATKWGDLSGAWNSITSQIKDKTATMKARVGTVWGDLSGAWSDITSQIKDKTATMYARIGSTWNGLRSSWEGLLSHFKDKAVSIKLSIDAKVSDLKNWFNNSVIARVNSAIHKIPILKRVSIPYLAKGGYVGANDPRLAVIGDNTHEGEIVSPVSKLSAMAVEAAGRVAAQMRAQNTAMASALIRQATPVLRSAGRSVLASREAAGASDSRTAPDGADMAKVAKLLTAILTWLQNRDVVQIDKQALADFFVQYHNNTVRMTGQSPLNL